MDNNMQNNQYNNFKENVQKIGKKSKLPIALITVFAFLVIIVTVILIWTSRAIDENKDEELVKNIKLIMDNANAMVTENKEAYSDENTTYYISNKCIKGSEKIVSPYGEFDPAYVVITKEGDNYSYYFNGRDIKGKGFLTMSLHDINVENLEKDLDKEDIVTNKGLGARTRIVVVDSSCKEKESSYYKVKIEKIEKYEFDDKKAVKIYAFREIEEEYTVTKVGIYYASNSGLGFYTNDSTDLTKDPNYDVEKILKNNTTGNVSEIVAKNPTNAGDYALIYTIVKETDMVYALPYVVAQDKAGKEYVFYGPAISTSYEQAKEV